MEKEEKKLGKSDVALKEEAILESWQKNRIFEKTLEKNSPKGEFVFYDGPPFATGLPHYGSLLGSIAKDLFPRYKTMQGYYVRRRWGWDCHGLPIENLVEKKLGLKHKKDIEVLGIEKFNEECRSQVLTYVHDWKKYIDRVARWVDFDGSYKTMDASFTESVWWALSEMNEKGLLYEGRKVLLYCPHCETPLAKAEIAMDNSYKDITEEAVTVEFKLKDDPKTSILAWTTTPWTLPGNVALAVHPDIDYVVIEKKDMGVGDLVRFILAKKKLEDIFGKDEYRVVEEKKGRDLVGLEYEPLYEIEAVKKTGKKAWYVTGADFVNTEEGTGVVHTAVIYGEDDFNLGQKIDLPMVPLLLPNGNFNLEAPEFIRGVYLKKAEGLIKEDLEKRGLLFDKKMNTHSYPHCYRCGTPLIYNALSSWFIDVQKIKDKIISTNENINWMPDHLKHGRFLDIMTNAPDWAISRNRFWASPLPIWKDSQGNITVVSGLEDLKKHLRKTGNKFFLIRHGGSLSNEKNVSSLVPGEENDCLTKKGEDQVRKSAKEFKDKVDLIITSNFRRTQKTAEIFAEEKGLSKEDIVVDDSLHEFIDEGDRAENYADVRKRMVHVLSRLDKEYSDKNILVVSHEYPLRVLLSSHESLDDFEESENFNNKFTYLDNAKITPINFISLPRNIFAQVDFHRPYIDEVQLYNDIGDSIYRIPEVIDCWVESGSMPFAEYNYPFAHKKEFEKRSPADFIAEYIPQTRTWFYYMHVVSNALFGHEAFKNVVTTGNVLAIDGSKMSKSKNNYTDPLILMDKFGADSLRYYLTTSVVMQAEDLAFSDKDVQEIHQRLLNILRNVAVFYETYKSDSEPKLNHENVLDKWISMRLKQLRDETTVNLDRFDSIRAGRPLKQLVDDLSTWYLRRSRERLKMGGEEGEKALQHLAFILGELSKLIAPFVPYVAEEIYQKVKGKRGLQSVHLESWPEMRDVNVEPDFLAIMSNTREIVTQALELRQEANIKVRQPLASLTIPESLPKEFLEILRDEVNVKEVKVGGDLNLDTNLTPELLAEGLVRDVIRGIQDVRKTEGLNPNQKIKIVAHADKELEKMINSNLSQIKQPTQVSGVSFSREEQKHKIALEKNKLSVSIEK